MKGFAETKNSEKKRIENCRGKTSKRKRLEMETVAGELERENARLKEEVALLTRALAAFESPTNSSATLADEQGTC